MANGTEDDDPTDPGAFPPQASSPPQGPGSMSYQDPSSTTPREPTLAEKKAREQAERRRQAAAAQEADDAEKSRVKRKRILIGAGVTVGLAAVVAVGYGISQSGGDESVQAKCVGEDGVVVDDSNCVTPASNNSYHSGGGFYPIFIGGGGGQYHYNYGGVGNVGQRVSGGGTSVPKDSTRVTTSSGKTLSGGKSSGSSVSDGTSGSVSRGGLGSSSGSSSSGS